MPRSSHFCWGFRCLTWPVSICTEVLSSVSECEKAAMCLQRKCPCRMSFIMARVTELFAMSSVLINQWYILLWTERSRPPKMHTLKLYSAMWWYLQVGPLGGDRTRWGHEHGTLAMGLVPLWESRESLLTLSALCVGHKEKSAVGTHGGRPISDFQPPGQSKVYCYSGLNRLRRPSIKVSLNRNT